MSCGGGSEVPNVPDEVAFMQMVNQQLDATRSEKCFHDVYNSIKHMSASALAHFCAEVLGGPAREEYCFNICGIKEAMALKLILNNPKVAEVTGVVIKKLEIRNVIAIISGSEISYRSDLQICPQYVYDVVMKAMIAKNRLESLTLSGSGMMCRLTQQTFGQLMHKMTRLKKLTLSPIGPHIDMDTLFTSRAMNSLKVLIIEYLGRLRLEEVLFNVADLCKVSVTVQEFTVIDMIQLRRGLRRNPSKLRRISLNGKFPEGRMVEWPIFAETECFPKLEKLVVNGRPVRMKDLKRMDPRERKVAATEPVCS